jgi:hypothetical protein
MELTRRSYKTIRIVRLRPLGLGSKKVVYGRTRLQRLIEELVFNGNPFNDTRIIFDKVKEPLMQ